MTIPATLQQVVQIGVETTPGTAVAANKLLQAVEIAPGIKANVQSFRPRGAKFPTVAALGRNWTEAKIGGQAVYTDIVYLLAGILAYQAPTQQGTSQAYKWTFTPDQSAADTIKTFTIEHGSAVRAGKFSYGLVNSFGLKFDRSQAEFSGSMLGQNYQDGISLTTSPTAIEPVPILPMHIDVFLDDSAAEIGTTKIEMENLQGSFEISDRFGAVWPINSSLSSFGAHVETVPKTTLKLFLAANAIGMSPLAAMQNGDKRWIRIKATGPVADTTYNYSFQLDICGTVTEVGEFSDQDGVYALEWTFQATYDAAWGKALSCEVINKLSTL